MALRGSLKDLTIVDLIQLPTSGHKSGELFIAGPVSQANLYYVKGKLVHATAGKLIDVQALVELVGWSEGEFEFRLDVPPPKVTIDMDLHRLLMRVLKIRDEQKEAENHKAVVAKTGPGGDPALLRAKLEKFLGLNAFILYAGIQTQSAMICEVGSPRVKNKEEFLRVGESFRAFFQNYPRTGLRRMLLEDSLGTVMVTVLEQDFRLIVVADKEASLGTVTMSVGRLTEAIMSGDKT